MIIQDGKMYMVRGDDESFEATITDDSGAAAVLSTSQPQW